MKDVDDDNDNDLADAQASDIPRPPEILGRGMRIRKQPQNYVPSMAGKKYELGVLNLCYRGNKYKLKDGVISINLDSHVPPSVAAS